MLGSGFSSNGQFEAISKISNYSSIDQLNVLEKFPIPTNKKIELSTDGLDLTNETKEFFTYSKEESLTDVIDNIEETIAMNELSVKQLNLLNIIIRKVNDYVKNTGNRNVFTTDNNKDAKILINLINKHNLDNGYVKNKHSVKNSIVSKIKQIISSPSNQILANIPVDVEVWQNAANAAIASKNIEKEFLSSYDMFSYYKQQRDASVGKDDVGIAANGLKVLFALTSYYNNYFNNFSSNNSEDIRRSNKTFIKEFKFSNGKTYKIGAISDVGMDDSQKAAIEKAIGNFDAFRNDAAISLSSFTSAATDNAKELLMAKINATVELASMHIYLLTLGFTPGQVSEIMTSEIIDDVISSLESNSLLGENSSIIPVIFKNLEGTYKNNESKSNDLAVLKDIYDGAQEIKFLAKILGANQKRSANVEKINDFLTSLETTLYARENNVFGNDLRLLNEWNKYKDSPDKGKAKEVREVFKGLVDKIMQHNKALNSKLDRKYVEDLLEKASNVSVSYVDEQGKRHSKYVSIIGGNFDFRYFVDGSKENDEYRKLTKQYYNLIKNTYNIFDVIDEVPHFKEMINGIMLSHNILMNTSIKYATAFTVVKDVLRENSHRVVFSGKEDNPNPSIKNQMGNPGLYPRISDQMITKSLSGIDVMLKSKWLKSEATSKLTFNVTSLIKQLNDYNREAKKDVIKNYLVYTSDEAWSNDNVSNFSKKVNEEDAEDTIITLDTNYGIANFKRLMEDILLPLLQKNSNILLDSLKIQEVKNIFGLRTSGIVSTFSLGELNNAVVRDKAQKLIKAFNDLDNNSSTKNLVKNSANELLRWKDLFYVYNLLLNNEKYGSLRLTPLFEDYIKEKDSLGYDYVMFSSKIDSGEINLFSIEDIMNEYPEYKTALESGDTETVEIIKRKAFKQLSNDILFYALQSGGKLTINNGARTNEKLSVTNGDFLVVTSITESQDAKKTQSEFSEVLRLLKSRGFIIKFEC